MSSLNPKSLACDRELLRQSLGDSLSEEQENWLADHLSQCVTCQSELEHLAAEGFELSRIREPLRCQAERASNASASAVGHPGLGGSSHHDDYLESQADFAVDFLDPATTPETLGRLGEIDIHETIGRGGMGIVLRGFQQELNRPVAVKVLAPHLATSGAARKRFAREAQAAAVIVHPNVMPILTVDSSGKLPYLVMPYVVCESLQQRLDRDGPLPAIDVLRIAMQIARGLAAAHSQGLVHRDVKPANVLLENGILRRITDNEPRDIREINPEIPDWLAGLVANLHREDAAERLSSAQQVAGLLEQCLAHVQHPTVSPLPEEVRRLARRASRSAKHQLAKSLGLAGRLGASLLGRRRLLAGAIVGSVLLAVMFIALMFRERPVTESLPPSGRLETLATEAHELVPVTQGDLPCDASTTTAWSDEMEEDFQEMDVDLHEFEQHTDLLWEKDAVNSD